MSEKSEALRLADWLEDQYDPTYNQEQAATELRRLHAECQHHKAWVAHITAENKSLEAQRDALLERADTLQRWYDQQLDSLAAVESQRDALLEALRAMLEQFNYHTITGIVHDESAAIAKARAAIKAVEEEGWVAAAQEAQKHFNAELKRYEGEKE